MAKNQAQSDTETDGGLFLCGETALACWQALRCTARPRLDDGETMPHVLARAGMPPARTVPFGGPPSHQEPWAAVAAAVERARQAAAAVRTSRKGSAARTPEEPVAAGPPPLPAGRPVDLLVGSAAARRNARGRDCRVWGGGLPFHAFVPLGDGVYLSRPEFVFLQLAASLDDVGLMLLGYEMCGFYAVGREGMARSDRCRPLTTVNGTRRFLASIGPRVRGLDRARRALRLVADRAASAGETATVALLCTKRVYGGYGIPLPSMNARVEIPPRLRELLGGTPLTCDAYWPDARFALEYDGRLDHEGARNVARDYTRASRMLAIGIGVETMTRRELFDPNRFDKTARRVARHIGYRLFVRDFGTAWHRRRAQLREAVLGQLFPRG